MTESDLVAYFCTEFGFRESPQTRSGGLGILPRRLTASVGLIKALGGGWSTTAFAQAAP